MAIDLQGANLNKEKIITTITNKGPSLPVQIAREVGLSPLFTSAFLSELYSEGKIKISHIKVGSSPLYYLLGQGQQLENFAQHLNSKEKEALELLKKEKVLEDEKQLPAIRVALRDLKDFALPVKIKAKDKESIFWKYFQLPDGEFRSMLQGNPDQAIAKLESRVEKDAPIMPPPAQDALSSESELPKEEKRRRPRALKEEDLKFVNLIKDYLAAKDVEILESVLEKKREFLAKIRIDTLFGKQEYYLAAKEKKKISTSDLTNLYQKAQLEKMPALLMAPGELDKNALAHIKEFKNLIKFEKIRF